MWSIYALFIYGSGLAILGTISLACFPGWRVTTSNVAWFVVGGFLGMLVLVGLGALALPPLLTSLGIRGEIRHGEWVGYALALIGAQLGGMGVLVMKCRLRKTWGRE